MPEFIEKSRYEDRLMDLIAYYGEEVYSKICSENHFDEKDNVFLSYYELIHTYCDSKEKLLYFSNWWKNKGVKRTPNVVQFRTIFKKQFLAEFLSVDFDSTEEMEEENDSSNDFVDEQNHDGESSETSQSIDLSKIENKLDESQKTLNDTHDIVSVIGQSDLENNIYEHVLNIEKTLNTQMTTRVEKKATFAQIEEFQTKLNDRLDELNTHIDSIKTPTGSDMVHKKDFLVGVGIGIVTGIVLMFIFNLIR